MRDSKSQNAGPNSEMQESYSHGYDSKFVDYLKGRSSANDAGFLLPYLRSGKSLLDCGCGPGAITVDLAEILAPGQVTGIDIAPNQIDLARTAAAERQISNIRFEVASVYELPFRNNSFDAAFAHTVLQHLREPVKALREIHRVIKPGGLIGVREEDSDGVVFSPSNAILYDCWTLYLKVWRHNGGDPYIARRHRGLLHEAGFIKVLASATAESYGTSEATRSFGEVMAKFMFSHLKTAIALGWIDSKMAKTLTEEWRNWGKHPDAFMALLRCEAIAWKP